MLLVIPASMLPAVVDSAGIVGAGVGAARGPANRGADRRPTSLADRSGVRPARSWRRLRSAPAACLMWCTDSGAPDAAHRHDKGTYPLPVWSIGNGELGWGVEGILLSAGTNVEWVAR